MPDILWPLVMLCSPGQGVCLHGPALASVLATPGRLQHPLQLGISSGVCRTHVGRRVLRSGVPPVLAPPQWWPRPPCLCSRPSRQPCQHTPPRPAGCSSSPTGRAGLGTWARPVPTGRLTVGPWLVSWPLRAGSSFHERQGGQCTPYSLVVRPQEAVCASTRGLPQRPRALPVERVPRAGGAWPLFWAGQSARKFSEIAAPWLGHWQEVGSLLTLPRS